MSAYILNDACGKMAKIFIYSDDWHSWFPLYVKVVSEGKYAGLYPEVKEIKAELLRSLSYLTVDEGVDPQLDLWHVRKPTDELPDTKTWGEILGSEPLPDDWIVNDKTAIYLKVGWDTSMKACDFKGGDVGQGSETDNGQGSKLDKGQGSDKDKDETKSRAHKHGISNKKITAVESAFLQGFKAGKKYVQMDGDVSPNADESNESSRESKESDSWKRV